MKEKTCDLINWIRAYLGVVFFFIWGINDFWLPQFIKDIMNWSLI